MLPTAATPPKPLLRGWIHATAGPVVLAAVVVLAFRAPTAQAVIAAIIFAVCAVTLFTMSAVYHIGHWSPKVREVLRSLDHANILLLIAGTYTPVAMLALRGVSRIAILCVTWAAASLGMAFQLIWKHLPRWVYVPLYLGMGWAAVFVLPQLARGAGPVAFALVVAGGVVYSIGGVIYGLKRPNPWPKLFGFHEIFHACTVAAFACQYVAISLLVCRAA